MCLLRLVLAVASLLLVPPPATAAQEWDSPRTREVVARAIARRADGEAAGSPRRWEAVARGMVLFLSQLGGDLATPRLVKADELAVEVYWEAPGRSKQSITAWRDRAWLPTDINYHRDHLGIVTNDFGPLIRLGDGDEVRDVPHPLSAAGQAGYEFGLVDSVSIASGGRTWQVYTLEVRPRDPRQPAVIGILYLDRESGALVRFRFSFTRSAYREAGLDDITVVLENALHDGGYWLPWRQEIEIRRRIGPVDFPARGIIRGHWELGEFRLDAAATPRPTAGPSIAGLRAPGGPPEAWGGSLEDRVEEVIGPVDRLEFETLRRQIARLAAGSLHAPGPPVRPAFGTLSDLARYNRVEGLRLGIGGTVPVSGGAIHASPWLGYGLSNRRISGRLGVRLRAGDRSDVRLTVERIVLDVGQQAVISPVLNSVLAQEFGQDRGDWVERSSIGVRWDRRSAGGFAVEVETGLEDWRGIGVRARPARGSFRPNPDFGAARYAVARAEVRRERSGGPSPGVGLAAAGEVGAGPATYLRVLATADWASRWGPGALRATGSAGWASADLPMVRGFVLGGWGSLPGTPYRGYGGRRMALARVEWLFRVPTPAWPMGSFPAPPGAIMAGPFVAAGVTGGPIAGAPWGASDGLQPVAGAALEALFGMLRLEVGLGLRGGLLSGSVDLSRAWWAVL